MRTHVVGSSCSFKILTPWNNLSYNICNNSCDGLICLYKERLPNVDDIDNFLTPTINYCLRKMSIAIKPSCPRLASWSKGKKRRDKRVHDKTNELARFVHDKNIATVCEVFDFTTNVWSYVVNSSPHQILSFKGPLYVDGSLYWFREGETISVLSFDLHNESFQVISEALFPHHHDRVGEELVMCDLNDRLCVSEKMWPKQVIWPFDSDHKTWSEIYSIDLIQTSFWFGDHVWAFTPLAVLDKDKLMFCEPKTGALLLALDPKTNSYQLLY